MMAVKAPIPISLNSGASSASFLSNSTYPMSFHSSAMSSSEPDISPTAQGDRSVESYSTPQATPQKETYSVPTTFEAHANNNNTKSDNDVSLNQQTQSDHDADHDLGSPLRSGSLKIDIDRSTTYDSSVAKEDEAPRSVIHAPLGFGKFASALPRQSSANSGPPTSGTGPPPKTMPGSTISTASSESIASAITVTRLVGADAEPTEKPTLIPPLLTQIPSAPEWTKTPRAQTRRDLGVTSRPGSSLSSLASISEAEDDYTDNPNNMYIDETEQVEDRPIFYRDDEEEFRTLQSALTECWTLCNTLAGLSYVHREKIFSKKGNMQQQAWRSCWKLCQNLYNARDETKSIDYRLTLDLCRDFCQSLFEVRAREDEVADSVLRVSFELNNHLFNTHDRNLPEAFSERTLDFYITLCHRLMKQRSKVMEETGSLLRACWQLAEMLFSIRQTRLEGRRPDEELLSSAIQACWELCDLFRDGWTQIRPDRQTPRPAQTTLTQAFQQAIQLHTSAPHETAPIKLIPETPTTVFEDITAESPYEANAPNIYVLGPGDPSAPRSAISTNPPSTSQLQPRQSAYRWPRINSTSSVTTLSTTSDNSLGSSVRTARSPSDDPNMALLKSLFVRAAMATNRGFSPLASTNITTVSARTSLPLFVKSLPEIAFGSQAWQMSLLDHYRKAVANDPSFRTLGVAASPTLLGVEGDESIQIKIRADTARAIQAMISSTFGWSWLRDLFRFAYGVYIDDVLDGHHD